MFTRGVTRFVCQMQIVIVLLEYKVEGDRTDTDISDIQIYQGECIKQASVQTFVTGERPNVACI